MNNANFQLTAQNAELVLKLTGKLYSEEAEAFDLELDHLFDQRPEQLIVDMSDLTAISSAGLGMLLKLQSRAKEHHCGMRLTALQQSIEKVVRSACLDRVFTIA